MVLDIWQGSGGRTSATVSRVPLPTKDAWEVCPTKGAAPTIGASTVSQGWVKSKTTKKCQKWANCQNQVTISTDALQAVF